MNPTLRTMGSFVLVLIFGSMVLLQMGWFLAHQMFGVQISWNILQYCLALIEEQTVGHSTVKIIFNLVILYTLSRIVWRTVKQIYLTQKWNRSFEAKKHLIWTKRLNVKYRHWKTRFLVVEDEAFIAITMGLFRPRIIISTGMLGMLPPKEIEAVLLHEKYHCRHHDPLKTFLFALAVDGMGYVPIIKSAAKHYHTWRELMADRFAIKQMGSEYYLGNVLLRLAKWGNAQKTAAGVPFADADINFRIQQVLDPDQPVQVPFVQMKSVVWSICIIMIILNIAAGGCS